MGTEFKRSNCAVCGQPMESDVLEDGANGTRSCRACAAAARRRAGTVLRHWTTNGLVFKGRATTTSEMGDWGLADGRQRNLVAARLKSLSSGVGAL
jgi:hypothetical protein